MQPKRKEEEHVKDLFKDLEDMRITKYVQLKFQENKEKGVGKNNECFLELKEKINSLKRTSSKQKNKNKSILDELQLNCRILKTKRKL